MRPDCVAIVRARAKRPRIRSLFQQSGGAEPVGHRMVRRIPEREIEVTLGAREGVVAPQHGRARGAGSPARRCSRVSARGRPDSDSKNLRGPRVRAGRVQTATTRASSRDQWDQHAAAMRCSGGTSYWRGHPRRRRRRRARGRPRREHAASAPREPVPSPACFRSTQVVWPPARIPRRLTSSVWCGCIAHGPTGGERAPSSPGAGRAPRPTR